jgi:flagellar hook-basal body complex protein FliE
MSGHRSTLAEWFDGFVGSEEERAVADALLAVVESATDLITNAKDSSTDVELEARRRLMDALIALESANA